MPNYPPLNLPPPADVERELARRSLANYVKLAWPVLEPATPLAWGWALDVMCNYLEAVSRGEITRLLINVPPGLMKSLLLNVFWPTWEWGALEKPHLRYLSTAHKEALAVRDNMKCRRLIQSAWYQELWPTKLVGDQNAKTKFENDKTGFRECMAFTSLTGSRGDRLMIDDPLRVDSANSQADLDAVERTFLEAVPSRLNNAESAIVVIMQRLHERDPSGIILSKPELGYTHLCLPMRYEGAQHPDDPRTKEGELLFPELYPEQRVVQLEASLGSYATAGQLQQRPVPKGGGLFKQEWLNYYTALPTIQHRIITADTAMKTKEHNDYTVMQCWGLSTDGHAYLLDQLRGKYEAPQLAVNAKAFYNKHRATQCMGYVRKFYVEDKASGTGLIQQLKQEGMPVEGIQRNTDKLTRAADAAPLVETRRVWLPKDAPWLNDFITEFLSFPNGAHDDQVDAFMDAVTTMLYLRKPNPFSQAMTE